MKKIINWLNHFFGIYGEEFAIDSIDQHIMDFGLDEPNLNEKEVY